MYGCTKDVRHDAMRTCVLLWIVCKRDDWIAMSDLPNKRHAGVENVVLKVHIAQQDVQIRFLRTSRWNPHMIAYVKTLGVGEMCVEETY